MGVCVSAPQGGSRYQVFVKTGDRIHQGTDADVSIAFYNSDGVRSRDFKLDNIFVNDFRQGKTDKFDIHVPGEGFARPMHVELRRSSTLIIDDEWFCEYVRIKCIETQAELVFPVHRWVSSEAPLRVKEHDMVLPQHDELIAQRRVELERKKKMYEAVTHPHTTMLQVS